MQNHRITKTRLAMAAVLGAAALVMSPAQAQYKCVVNGKVVVQPEPCADPANYGKYRCYVDGEVIYQSTSCVAKAPAPVAQSPAAPAVKPPAPVAVDRQKDAMWVIQNEDLVRRKLRDPDSARFAGSFVSRISGSPIVCGLVNARNAFGGYAGDQRFVSAGSALQVLESDMQRGEMDKLWMQFCRAY